MICPQCGTERNDYCSICGSGMCCCLLPIYDKPATDPDRKIQRTRENLQKHQEEIRKAREQQ